MCKREAAIDTKPKLPCWAARIRATNAGFGEKREGREEDDGFEWGGFPSSCISHLHTLTPCSDCSQTMQHCGEVSNALIGCCSRNCAARPWAINAKAGRLLWGQDLSGCHHPLLPRSFCGGGRSVACPLGRLIGRLECAHVSSSRQLVDGGSAAGRLWSGWKGGSVDRDAWGMGKRARHSNGSGSTGGLPLAASEGAHTYGTCTNPPPSLAHTYTKHSVEPHPSKETWYVTGCLNERGGAVLLADDDDGRCPSQKAECTRRETWRRRQRGAAASNQPTD